jgi:ABC-type amino acid transport substrate-binding protein
VSPRRYSPIRRFAFKSIGFVLALAAITLWNQADARAEQGLVDSPSAASGAISRVEKTLTVAENKPRDGAQSTILQGETAAKNPFQLTGPEKIWLRDIGDIRIGVMNAWPPMAFVDETGRKRGVDVELINALNRRLNGTLKITSDPWNSIYESVKNKTLDALMGVTPRDDRAPFFNFTDPYIVIPHVIFGRHGENDGLSLETLSDHSVAVEEGFFIASLLGKMYPRIKVKLYKTTRDALRAVSNGEATTYIGNRAAALYIIRTEAIPNLRQFGKISEAASINAIGVRKD